ncbi:hypothetical protein [Gemmatimonas phototrophica]|uniref:Uncharacterized protein n=1 Tax=Gemmatimonas phototrophica TaxID=1379270 RepID=A0A143BNM3_9BACT|nr:hypothetical protein [Gemmatimonas phototrophica]AMW06233.1 hypothetical protein GEMMAAP_18485 [Gemmatimonas phototrophica]
MSFSPAQRDALAALATAIIDGAPPAAESIPELAARCEARLGSLPPHRRQLVGTALSVLGSGATVALAIQRVRPFAQLAPVDQARCVAAWADSSLPPIRSAWQSVRRLVLSVHYARPEVAAAIGYGGPFRLRQSLHPWEGALPEGTSPVPGEPVARGRVILPNIIDPDPVPVGVVPGHQVTGNVQRTADVVVIGTARRRRGDRRPAGRGGLSGGDAGIGRVAYPQ